MKWNGWKCQLSCESWQQHISSNEMYFSSRLLMDLIACSPLCTWSSIDFLFCFGYIYLFFFGTEFIHWIEWLPSYFRIANYLLATSNSWCQHILARVCVASQFAFSNFYQTKIEQVHSTRMKCMYGHDAAKQHKCCAACCCPKSFGSTLWLVLNVCNSAPK